jgi:hypothetical protein
MDQLFSLGPVSGATERGLVQHEADDGRREIVELDPDNRTRVVEKDELQDEWGAADEPDVEPCRSTQRRQCGTFST